MRTDADGTHARACAPGGDDENEEGDHQTVGNVHGCAHAMRKRADACACRTGQQGDEHLHEWALTMRPWFEGLVVLATHTHNV